MAILVSVSLVVSAIALCAVFHFFYSQTIYRSIQEKAEHFHGSTLNAARPMLADISPGEMRITVVSPDGRVLYDNTANTEGMANHADRKEIQDALESGRGEDTRFSNTLDQETWYYAVRMADGNVLRAAKTTSNIFSLFARMIPVVFIIMLGLILFSDYIAGKLTRRIVAPLNNAVLDGEYVPPYDELAPFAEKIAKQRRKIRSQLVELEEASKLRREFSANVSHELKTPLTTIAGYAEMLHTGMVSDADRREVTEKIYNEAGRMIALVDDIMKLSHLDEGSPGAAFENVDIAAIARSTAESLAGKAAAMNVTLNVTPDGGPCNITANPSMMHELFFTLMENAIKNNKNGGTVTVRIAPFADRTRVEVSDTGIGIPRDAQPHVFDRFYRVDKSRSRSTGGTGLGLAIVKHIAQLHNAQIRLESEEGRGTTVLVDFMG
jgi:two-component system phosphate regulon sensor histidine kinase PhoR